MANDFLSIPELKTHLYEEIADEITRSDDTIIEEAIATAMEEAKGYLTKYDITAVFTYTVSPEYPTLNDWLEARHRKLLSIVKDVAAWHLIRLANPNIELNFRRMLYEDAVKWMQSVQAGKVDPLLPVPAPSTVALGNAGSLDGQIKWESNVKRNNHF